MSHFSKCNMDFVLVRLRISNIINKILDLLLFILAANILTKEFIDGS